jgi:hypothetical protein
MAIPMLGFVKLMNLNPNPHCLGTLKAFFVLMKISPG